ncbi:MAG: HPr kinase/phosphatase C-terminal domain-containing protein [Alphaproteobacteria bacterium]|nr:HPr kinase/phosphatase C-terminal domain-containing protein [Alphaproteobacteria bacterium]
MKNAKKDTGRIVKDTEQDTGKSKADTICLHATCLVIDDIGVLLRGASGCGKSDLALRVIKTDIGRLVADDQVSLTAQKNLLIARPPPRLAGLIEVRGLGLLPIAYEPSCPIKLLVNLVSVNDKVAGKMADREAGNMADAEAGTRADGGDDTMAGGAAAIPPLAPPVFERILNIAVPTIQLCAYEPSAPQKLAIAAKHIGLYGFPQENGRLG